MIIDYIDRIVKFIFAEVDSRCKLWTAELVQLRTELTGLRTEWNLQHINLIQRFESFVAQYEVEKKANAEHFVRQNDMQNRMDKMAVNFATTEQVNQMISAAIADQSSNQTKYTAILIVLLVAALSLITYLLTGR